MASSGMTRVGVVLKAALSARYANPKSNTIVAAYFREVLHVLLFLFLKLRSILVLYRLKPLSTLVLSTVSSKVEAIYCAFKRLNFLVFFCEAPIQSSTSFSSIGEAEPFKYFNIRFRCIVLIVLYRRFRTGSYLDQMRKKQIKRAKNSFK